MSLPNIVLTGPPEMAEDHHILGTGGPLGQWSKKLISNPAPPLPPPGVYFQFAMRYHFWMEGIVSYLKQPILPTITSPKFPIHKILYF